MPKHHSLQLILFCVYLVIATMVMVINGIGITPDRYLVVIFVGALLIRHSKNLIHDFAPFILILIAYDFLRGFADNLDPTVHYQLPIRTTLWLFNGHVPTVDLQRIFYTPGVLHWYDYAASYLYVLHFAVPLLLAFLLWFYNRSHFREFMLGLSLTSYAALIAYLIYPVAPPWLASQMGFIPPVTKILNVVMAHYPETIKIPTLYHIIGPNLVAAIPSMHAGYSFLVLLYALKFFKNKGLFFLPYTVLMWFDIVYLGEHYFIDIILGGLVALIMFHISHFVVRKFGKQLEIL